MEDFTYLCELANYEFSPNNWVIKCNTECQCSHHRKVREIYKEGYDITFKTEIYIWFIQKQKKQLELTLKDD